jgi:beta-1,4-mannosyl-glycoprotein beta-1,4-N-acetylglucosaminyltransferase
MKIYDTFRFFNELDMLELRLNILYDVVDYFIISEFNITFTGNKKDYIFEKNKDRFSKFLDKIIYIKQDLDFDNFNNVPLIENPQSFKDHETNKLLGFFNNATHFSKFEPHWCRDYLHREMIRLGYETCNDEDIILTSDIDEIPNPKILQNLDKFYEDSKIYILSQNMYYYYFNVLKERNWKGSTLISWKRLKDVSLNDIRCGYFDSIINNGGWHFSYMGGVDAIKDKIVNFGHQEINRDDIKDNLDNIIGNLKDIYSVYGRKDTKLEKVEIDDTYPEYIINNKDKLDIFIL